MVCPLCKNTEHSEFFRDKRRVYRRCGNCQLVFVPAQYFLSPAEEKAEYDLHENHVDDPGYRQFLARLADPLCQRLENSSNGLDFGCGPGPALAQILSEKGHQVALYDPFYRADPACLNKEYDFVTATEVVEHLHDPAFELERLWSLLRPGAWLGVMTKLVVDQQAFANWHYKNDPTHVCFFSRETWSWWASAQGGELEFAGSDVILLRRPR
jgi:hypothetical protein